jgi:D-glycero-D-manno-heptose 1,7-bisphosphate phosphatase
LTCLKPKETVGPLLDTIFFDRDGVINEVVLQNGEVSSPRTPDQFHLRSDFITTYDQLPLSQLSLFVVSNQPDVSRGLLSEDALDAMTKELETRFQFKEVLCCMHDNHHNCLCRKPKPGMLNYLIKKYGIDRSRSVLIGDSKKDILAGAAAGIMTIYLRQDYNQVPGCEPDYIIDSLQEILGIIINT